MVVYIIYINDARSSQIRLNITLVFFWLTLQLLCETFLFMRRMYRDYMYRGLHVKYPLFRWTDRETNMRKEANSRFSPFCERALKRRRFCISFSFEILDVRSSAKAPASFACFAASRVTAFDISSWDACCVVVSFLLSHRRSFKIV